MAAEISENDETTINRIRDRIIGLVEHRFGTGEKTVYLSRLGNELGSDRLTLERLTGIKLNQYLRYNLPYPIEATGQHGNILFLVSPDADVTSFTTAPSSSNRPPAEQASPATAIPRYAPRFWAAFAKPLQPGETERFINLSTLFFGPDAAALQRENADDIRPIESEYIAPQGASGSASETAERIARWINSQGLDSQNYIVEPKRSADKHESLLAVVIDTLTPEQRKRVMLPLDVIKVLSEHRT